MFLHESIYVYPPFGERNSVSPRLLYLLKQHSWPFRDGGAGALVLHERHEPGRFDAVKRLVEREFPTTKVSFGIGPEYEDADFAAGELFDVTGFAEGPIAKGFYELRSCEACGDRPRDYWNGRRPRSIEAKGLFLYKVGLHMIHYQARSRFESVGISGIEFYPLDEEGRYSYFTANTDLGDIVLPPEEVVDYRGRCPKCRRYLWTRFIGPTRHRRANWNGDDVVSGGVLTGPLFSRRALQVMQELDPSIKPSAPVLLVD
jgi:hypothetical protein